MAKATKISGASGSTRRDRPALDPEARERQLIAKAERLAEKQLDDGTASSQIVVHYLKLGTAKAELEKEKIKHENELLRAKTEALESAKHIEELYSNALKAMSRYSGQGGVSDDEY